LFFQAEASIEYSSEKVNFTGHIYNREKLHVYAARQIMPRKAQTIAKKSAYSNDLRHLQRGIYPA